MSATCTVCGKQRAPSDSASPNRLSRIGLGIAFVTLLAPIGVLLWSMPFFVVKVRPARSKPLVMCQVCEWTFGAFAIAVLLIAAGITYLVLSVNNGA